MEDTERQQFTVDFQHRFRRRRLLYYLLLLAIGVALGMWSSFVRKTACLFGTNSIQIAPRHQKDFNRLEK